MIYWQICRLELSKNRSPISKRKVWFAKRIFYGYVNNFWELPTVEDLRDMLEDYEGKSYGKFILQINLPGIGWKTIWKAWATEEIILEGEY